jgi:ribosomal protein L11
LHELSSIIMFDRDSQFISLIWKKICEILKINLKLSTAFYLETNEQSEIANQEIKKYLRNYCNYQQDDWSNWLSMIEFIFNATIFAFTELFAFMTNYEFESRMSFDSFTKNNSKSTKKCILSRKDLNIIEKMKNIWEFTKKKLAQTQNIQKKYVDQKKTSSFEYKCEDMIWLFIKNIKIERSSKKLNHKWIELYKIKKISKDVCQLDLSQSMKIHDTFYISLLKSTSNNSFIEQIQSSSSLIIVENEKKEYKINDILNSRYHYNKLQYKVI